ncbi:hypothetical protein E2C01_057166 [Portunus trituberculatus]|uniref:Uncharacterized protein n=1 Tax=Portunus trituberculatus TaxID=210409 RepID=A0A5B7H2M0_PORTR|nr:hypothetical protein [Portunus trituberculatus]
MPGKQPWRGGFSASLLSGQTVMCSRCVAHISCCRKWRKEDVAILTISEEQKCEGMGVMHLQLDNGASVDVKVFVVSDKPLGFPFVLGMNSVMAFGGVSVNAHRQVRFGIEDAQICVRGTPCMCCRLTRGGDRREKRETRRCVRVTAKTVLSAALLVLCSVNKLQLGEQCFKLRPATETKRKEARAS